MIPQKTRDELAGILFEHRDVLASTLIAEYDRQYPSSATRLLDRQGLSSLALRTIDDLAQSIARGTVMETTYRDLFGDTMVDPHDEELSQFSTFVSSLFFWGRCVAPLVSSVSFGRHGQPRPLLDALEQIMQENLRVNVELYLDRMMQPGALAKSWKVTRPQAGPNTAPRCCEPSSLASSGALSALTPREERVLSELLDGKSNKSIASSLGISLSTVKNHVSHIFEKCQVRSRAELIAEFRRQ